MTYDPNLPPSSRERLHNPDIASPRTSGSTGWMIGLLILALVIVGAFFVWPDRAGEVAGTNAPATTGATPAPRAPAPAAPAPAPVAPANPAPATPR